METLNKFHPDLIAARQSQRRYPATLVPLSLHDEPRFPSEDSKRAVTYSDKLDFGLPPELEAGEPPEARGLARDEVRLMVSYRSDNRVVHTRFRELGNFLVEGDLLVINTSGT